MIEVRVVLVSVGRLAPACGSEGRVGAGSSGLRMTPRRHRLADAGPNEARRSGHVIVTREARGAADEKGRPLRSSWARRAKATDDLQL